MNPFLEAGAEPVEEPNPFLEAGAIPFNPETGRNAPIKSPDQGGDSVFNASVKGAGALASTTPLGWMMGAVSGISPLDVARNGMMAQAPAEGRGEGSQPINTAQALREMDPELVKKMQAENGWGFQAPGEGALKALHDVQGMAVRGDAMLSHESVNPGGAADALNRAASSLEQTQNQGFGNRMVRGTVNSLAKNVPVAMLGGPMAAAGFAAADTSNQSYTQALDKLTNDATAKFHQDLADGVDPSDAQKQLKESLQGAHDRAARYASTQGAIEGVASYFLGSVFEKAFGAKDIARTAASAVSGAALKQNLRKASVNALKSMVAEVGEEALTGIAQKIDAKIEGIDDKAVFDQNGVLGLAKDTWDEIGQTVGQAVLGAGAANLPNVAIAGENDSLRAQRLAALRQARSMRLINDDELKQKMDQIEADYKQTQTPPESPGHEQTETKLDNVVQNTEPRDVNDLAQQRAAEKASILSLPREQLRNQYKAEFPEATGMMSPMDMANQLVLRKLPASPRTDKVSVQPNENITNQDTNRAPTAPEANAATDLAAPSQEPVSGFTTSQGSTYEIDDQGRTTRTKTPHLGHDPKDVGLKQQSEQTYYVDSNQATELGMHQGISGGSKEHPNGVLVSGDRAYPVTWNDAQGKYGVAPSAKEGFPLSTTPEVGKAPLELWKKQDSPQGELWTNWHPGNAITEVRQSPSQNLRSLSPSEVETVWRQKFPDVRIAPGKSDMIRQLEEAAQPGKPSQDQVDSVVNELGGMTEKMLHGGWDWLYTPGEQSKIRRSWRTIRLNGGLAGSSEAGILDAPDGENGQQVKDAADYIRLMHDRTEQQAPSPVASEPPVARLEDTTNEGLMQGREAKAEGQVAPPQSEAATPVSQPDSGEPTGKINQSPFDSEKFDADREATIKASKESGKKHLDQVPLYVETLRGQPIYNAHDPNEAGHVVSVSNNGDVVVRWKDDYSEKKNSGLKETWLGPTDLKDYVLDEANAKPPKKMGGHKRKDSNAPTQEKPQATPPAMESVAPVEVPTPEAEPAKVDPETMTEAEFGDELIRRMGVEVTPQKSADTVSVPAEKPAKKRIGKEPKPSKRLGERAAEARQEFLDEAEKLKAILKSKGLMSVLPGAFDPDLVVPVARLAAKAFKAGVYTFAEFVDESRKLFGDVATKKIAPYLERAWTEVHNMTGGKVDQAGSVSQILGETNVEVPDSPGNTGVANEPGSSGGESPAVPAGTNAGRKPRKRLGPQSTAVSGSPDGVDRSEPGRGTGSAQGDSARPVVRAEPGLAGGEAVDQGAAKPAAEVRGELANHVIEPGDELATSSEKKSLDRNVTAIKLLKQLEAESRPATIAEKKKLAQYTGWGGLPQAFDRHKGEAMINGRWGRDENWEKKWGEAYKTLKDLLTEDEWIAARDTTTNAHYTSRHVIEKMWDLVDHLGFKGGKVLEPGSGIGHFAGLVPSRLRQDTKFVMVERDSLTSRIAAKLYPQATVHGKSLEEVRLAPGSVDLVIGNVPFAKDSHMDDAQKRYKTNLNLHNYFIARSLDAAKPGGLVVVISTHNTLDAEQGQRKFLATKGDLVGAIRLPNNAFKENAKTEVVTDILVFRRPDGSQVESQPFTLTKEVPGLKDARINEYFIAHPEMVLGKNAETGSMYKENEYTVEPTAGSLTDKVSVAIDSLPRDVLGQNRVESQNEVEPDPQGQEGHLSIEGGHVVLSTGGKKVRITAHAVEGFPHYLFGKTGEARAKDYIGLRDAFADLRKTMLSPDATDADVKKGQKALEKAYDSYVKKHGPLARGKTAIFKRDPEYYRVLSLENEKREKTDDGTIRSYFEKAAVFNVRTLGPRVAPASAANVKDGLNVSMAFKGDIDPEYIANLTGKTVEQVEAVLPTEGLAYRDPASQKFVHANKYLSGNVRTKLAAATDVAEIDNQYQPNVEALKKIQPERVPISKISYRLGSNWIKPDVVQSFARETLGDQYAGVKYDPQTDTWSVEMEKYSANAKERYGTARMPAGEVLQSILNLQAPKVYDAVPTGEYNDRGQEKTTRVLNEKETMAAKKKAKDMQTMFKQFVGSNPHIGQLLENSYNDTYNSHVDASYDGSHLELPGMSPEIKLRPYQKNAIWRMVQDGRALLAHAVGAGKAQPLDAKVLTPTGWKKMGDIIIGDEVIAGDGTVTTVTGVFPQGRKEIFAVKFSDGSSTECCKEHLWLTQTYKERTAASAQKDKQWPSAAAKVRSLEEIATTVIDKRLNTPNHSIPMVGAVQFSGSALPIDPYTLGVLLGDGCVRGKSVTVCGVDKEIIGRIKTPDGTELRRVKSAVKCPTWAIRMTKQSGFGYDRAPNPMVTAMRTLGLMNCLSEDKFIPDIYLFASETDRLEILRGLMDTDGSATKRGAAVFYSVSERLVDGVRHVVQSLGGTVSVTTKTPKFKHLGKSKIGKTCFVMHVCLPPTMNPFSLGRKASRVIAKTSYAPSRRITEVTSAGEKLAQCISVAHPSHLYVTDDFIVTHNTYTMIGAAMELRRTGLANRPLVVVQNATLGQFATSFMKMYPNARVLVATKDDLGTGSRQLFLSRITTGNWDAVVMAQSTFDNLSSDPAVAQAYIQDQLGQLEEAIHEEGGERSRTPTVKDLVKQRQALQKNLDKVLADEVKNREKNKVYFDDLGVDALFLDEAHAYKKPFFISKMNNLVGLNKQASGKGVATQLKVRQIQEKTGGRNIFFATGTPITNTLGEAWHMVNFIAPDVNEDFGVRTFDGFIGAFAEQDSVLEMNAGGEWVSKDAIVKFTNGPELIRYLRSTWDILSPDNLKAYMSSSDKGLPTLRGGKVQAITVEQTPALVKFSEYLKKVYATYKALPAKDRREFSYIAATAYGAAKAASIDIRLIHPSAKEEADSKVHRLVDLAIEEYENSTDRKGVQMIFSDIFNPRSMRAIEHFMGQSVPKDGVEIQEDDEIGERDSFLFKDIRKKLIAKGVPASEIAIVAEYDTDKKRAELWDRANAGDIRFLMGSSSKMGVGVNVQERLVGLHHLDTPWLPADVEQREGRIIRHGNTNAEVGIYRYAMKKTLDAAIYNKTSRKAKFIWQAMAGKFEGRDFEDPASELTMSIDEQLAAIQGDPLAFEKLELDQKRRELQLEREAFEDSVQRAEHNTASYTAEIKRIRGESIPRQEKLIKEVTSLVAGEQSITINGKTYSDREAANEAMKSFLDSHVQKIEKQIRDKDLRDSSPSRWTPYHDSRYLSADFQVQGLIANIATGGEIRDGSYNDHTFVAMRQPGDKGNLYDGNAKTGFGLIEAAKDIPDKMRSALDGMHARISKLEKEIADLATVSSAEWDGQAKLDAINKRMEEISDQLQANSKLADPHAGEKPPTDTLSGEQEDTGSRSIREEADQANEDDPGSAMYGFLGGGTTGRNRNDRFPSQIQADNPDVERQLQDARGAKPETLLDRLKAVAATAWYAATRSQLHIPNDAKHAVMNEMFRNYKDAAKIADDEANRTVAAILDPLGPKKLILFERKAVIDNLLDSVDRGEPLRFGFQNREEVVAYKEKLDAIATKDAEVSKAFELRERAVQDVVGDLIDLGLLGEDSRERAKTYYHQQVLSYVNAGKIGRNPKITKKTFQKSRVKGESLGEEDNYNTNYIEAEKAWLRDAYSQIQKERWLRNVEERFDIRDELAKESEATGKTVQELKSESATHSNWQAAPGNVFYRAIGVAEHAVEEVLRGGPLATAEVSIDDLSRMIAMGGKQRELFLPNELVAQLQSMEKQSAGGDAFANGIASLSKETLGMWKVWQLFSPQRAIAYNLGNLVGDIDPVIGGAPWSVTYAPQAINELSGYYGIGRQQKLALSPVLEAARDLGVIDSSATAQNIPDLENLAILQRFYTEPKGLARMAKTYFDTVKKYSAFRESISRLAAFMYYRDALQKGTLAHYGGARKEVVDALVKEMGVDAAAAHLARNLLGDYGDLTVMGEYLRAHVFPFWSWSEVNLKRYPQMTANAAMFGYRSAKDNPAKAAAYSMAALSALAIPYLLMQIYNNLVWGDDEDELSDDERASPHLILGKYQDGSLVIKRNTGALGDFLEWFGVNTMVSRLDEINAGQMSFGEVAQEMGKDVLNKGISGIRPDVKGIVEVATGQSLYPNALNPRPADRDEMVAGYVNMADAYRQMKGTVLRDGTRSRPHFLGRMIGIVDPRKNALYEVAELRDRYLDKIGDPKFPRNKFMINMRDAAAADDWDAFAEARKKYIENGGDFDRFMKSAERYGDPLSGLSQEKREDFTENYLTPDQREKLSRSLDYGQGLRVKMWQIWHNAAKGDSPEVAAKLREQQIGHAVRQAKQLLEQMPSSLTHKERADGLTIPNKRAKWRQDRQEAYDSIQTAGVDDPALMKAMSITLRSEMKDTDKIFEKLSRLRNELHFFRSKKT
jgi:N12 class adenine-specific DNA methylase